MGRSYRHDSIKLSLAGQRWILEHFEHIQHSFHIQNMKHIQQCQSWTAQMIEEYCLAFEKKTGYRPTDHPTDGRTHPHIEMGGPI